MASKRSLKKNVNDVCFDIIDELLTMQDMYNPHQDKIRELLEETVVFRNQCIDRINAARKAENPAEVLHKINEDLEEQTISFIDRLNQLG